MRITDRVDVTLRRCQDFPPHEFIFWVGVHEGQLMTAQKRQTRLIGEDMSPINTLTFSAETGVVMPIRPNCQLFLGRTNELRMRNKEREQQILPPGGYINREIMHLAEDKCLVSSFGTPHTIVEYMADRQRVQVHGGIGEGHQRFIYSALLMAEYLVTCSTDQTVKIADTVTGYLVRKLSYPCRLHSLIKLSPDSLLIGPAEERSLDLYDHRCRRLAAKYEVNQPQTFSGLLLNSNEVLLGHNERLSKLDLRKGLNEQLAIRLPHKVWNMQWVTQNTKLLVSGGCFAAICSVTGA